MSIIDNIKDTARKATDSIVDATENMVNKPKSSKELATRLVEHLSHREYTKIAEILSDEAKKYAKHMGIDDFALVETKLNEFKSSMESVAEDLEEGDYSTVATRIKQIESSIPSSIANNTEIPESLKNLLQEIVKILEDYNQNKEAGDEDKKPDFSKLQDVVEGYFNKMISNKQ